MNRYFKSCGLASVIVSCAVALTGCITTRDELGKKDDVAAAQANMQLGINAMQQNNLSEAKAKIDKALTQDSKSADVHFVAGILYARIKEYGKADGYYERAIDLEPRNSDYVNGYAVYLCGRKNYEKGEKLALKAAENPLYKSPHVALLNAGICAMDAGHAGKAEEYFRRALKIQPDFSAALLYMAELELKSGNFLSARAFLERYQQYGPAIPKSLLLGVRIERGMGNPNAAQNYARRLNTEFPTSEETKALTDVERK
jgi:type IV pilus assembly protein PilF